MFGSLKVNCFIFVLYDDCRQAHLSEKEPKNFGPPVGTKEWKKYLAKAVQNNGKVFQKKLIANVLMDQQYFNGVGKYFILFLKQ